MAAGCDERRPAGRVEVGQVWWREDKAVLRRVVEMDEVSGYAYAPIAGSQRGASINRDFLVNKYERAPLHPWEADPDWCEGDEYHAGSFLINGVPDTVAVVKIRGGKPHKYAHTGDEYGAVVFGGDWGPRLTFTPTWREFEPSGAGTSVSSYAFGRFKPGFAAYVDAEPAQLAQSAQEPLPEKLTPGELIAIVQGLCPPERNSAAWGYTVDRLFRGDPSLMDPTAYGLGYISPGCANSFTRCINAHIGLTGSLPGRLYLDGLRQVALDAMPCPDGHDAERWRQKCLGHIEGEANRYRPLGSPASREVELLTTIADKVGYLFPDTDDPGPANKWWQGDGCSFTRGAHLEDVEAIES